MIRQTPNVFWEAHHHDLVAKAELDLGHSMMTSNRLVEGEALMRESLKRKKSCIWQCQASSLLSDILYRSGKLDEAEECALSVLELVEKLPSSIYEESVGNAGMLVTHHSLMGTIYEKKHLWDHAIRHDMTAFTTATAYPLVELASAAPDTIRRF